VVAELLGIDVLLQQHERLVDKHKAAEVERVRAAGVKDELEVLAQRTVCSMLRGAGGCKERTERAYFCERKRNVMTSACGKRTFQP